MTKATPLPLYDEFMLVFRKYRIENWEAKDFVKVISSDSQNSKKKIRIQIYKALRILVRFNYLTIDKSKSTKKLFSYCETKRLQELMCAEKTGGFNLVNYRHSSGVYHEQETEDLHRRI